MLPSEYPEVQLYPELKHLLASQVDMQFADLRTMLRLPLEDDLTGGCNFAATAMLCHIIGGACYCFYHAEMKAFKEMRGSGRRFKQLLCDFYPWRNEPLAKCRAVELIYKWTRNPLIHTLGLDAARPRDPMITLAKSPLTREQIDALEEDEERPAFASFTVSEKDKRFEISVHAMYWGTHRMLRALFADQREAEAAETLASQLRTRGED